LADSDLSQNSLDDEQLLEFAQALKSITECLQRMFLANATEGTTLTVQKNILYKFLEPI